MKKIWKALGFILISQILLLSNCIQRVFADSYTRYPPYEIGYSGGGGHADLLAYYTYIHHINLSNGIVELYARATSAYLGGAMGEAWGFMGFSWTAPSPPSGGCPYVLVWDRSKYVLDNNILPASEMSNGTDVEDYYKLVQSLVPDKGRYSLLISEFEQEHSYIDQVKLMAVDHDSGVNIAVTRDGEILTYENPVAPISCVDNYGNDRLSEISLMDGNVSDPTTYFDGKPGDYLVLNFGQVDPDYDAKLIMRADTIKKDECIEVQVISENGEWQTVATVLPRAYWAIDGINLSPNVVQDQDLYVRLFWKNPHRLDFVGLDTTPQGATNILQGDLIRAIHSNDGDVKSKLRYVDSIYAELLPGKQIELKFTLPKNSMETRSFIVYTKGYYVKTTEDDPIVTVSSKLTLKGFAHAVVSSITPFGARAKFIFEIWLEVYDITAGSYVTETLVYDLSKEAIAPGEGIPWVEDQAWDEERDAISTFSAIEGHTYNIYIGIHVQAIVANIGGYASAYIDFYSADRYILMQYIHLSW